MGNKKQTQAIQDYILEKVDHYPSDIAKMVAKRFNVSIQGSHYHLNKLLKNNILTKTGSDRNTIYSLSPFMEWHECFEITDQLDEFFVWDSVRDKLEGKFQNNVLDILEYGFTEMVNNAKDHSEGDNVCIQVLRYAKKIRISISDDGVGIFNKIKREEGLENVQQAVIVLSKGKYTTDPENHSGQGIFFTSRAFDIFDIDSGNVTFIHERTGSDWLIDDKDYHDGTIIFMEISTASKRNLKKIFDEYSTDDGEYAFNKTIIPVRKLSAKNEGLVSRSQAKRLMAGLDQFEFILLDFTGVKRIGQAFADNIFRVWRSRHPDIDLQTIGANKAVKEMINRAKGSGFTLQE